MFLLTLSDRVGDESRRGISILWPGHPGRGGVWLLLLGRWLVLLLLLGLLLLLLLGLLLLLLLLWLLLGTSEINCLLIRLRWPDRARGGDRSVPGIDFWDRLGCPSRWWRCGSSWRGGHVPLWGVRP